MNIRDKILQLIETDTDYTSKSDSEIVSHYQNSDITQKMRIDHIFISLTGYSLDTIIKEKGLV